MKLALITMLLLGLNIPFLKSYEFIGYTERPDNTKKEYKYEKTKLNKFYKNEESNIIYGEKDIEYPEAPYIDLNDKKIECKYLKDKPFYEKHEHTVTLKNKLNYETDKINIINLDTGYDENKIHELEVYYKDEKIEINLDKDTWLNDGIKNNGKAIFGNSYSINLNNLYNINDLKLKIYYDYNVGYDTRFNIEFENKSGENLNDLIRFNHYIEKDKITTVDVMDEGTFKKVLPENGIIFIRDAERINQAEYFKICNIKYKHYNVIKNYFISTTATYVEGYSYDPIESINIYKIYKKEPLFKKKTKTVLSSKVYYSKNRIDETI